METSWGGSLETSGEKVGGLHFGICLISFSAGCCSTQMLQLRRDVFCRPFYSLPLVWPHQRHESAVSWHISDTPPHRVTLMTIDWLWHWTGHEGLAGGWRQHVSTCVCVRLTCSDRCGHRCLFASTLLQTLSCSCCSSEEAALIKNSRHVAVVKRH